MATKPTRNSGKPWNDQEIETIRTMAQRNAPPGVIGLKLGRTPSAIRRKASQERISLKPR